MMESKIKQQRVVRHMEFLMEIYQKTVDRFTNLPMTRIASKHSVQSIAVLVMIENKLIEVDNMDAKRYRKYKWGSPIPPNIHTAEKLIELIDRKFKFYKENRSDTDVVTDKCISIKDDDRQFPRTERFALTLNRAPYIKMALNMVGKSISDDLLSYIDDITYLINKNNGDVTFNEIASLASFKKLQLAGVKLPGTNQIQ